MVHNSNRKSAAECNLFRLQLTSTEYDILQIDFVCLKEGQVLVIDKTDGEMFRQLHKNQNLDENKFLTLFKRIGIILIKQNKFQGAIL